MRDVHTQAQVIKAIRDSFEELISEWKAPVLGNKVGLLDCIFAYRLLLGRNPDMAVEMPYLHWRSGSKAQTLFGSSWLHCRAPPSLATRSACCHLDTF